jgi:hypothetical protein
MNNLIKELILCHYYSISIQKRYATIKIQRYYRKYKTRKYKYTFGIDILQYLPTGRCNLSPINEDDELIFNFINI